MATENGINLITEVSLEKMRAMAESGVVIGDPITMPNGVTAVPVSRVSIGFGSGGSDIMKSGIKDGFTGGCGGGVTITPIAFLVTHGDGVKIMQLDTIGSTADNIVRTIPEIMDQISGIIGSRKDGK